jgi:hypothetical protein
MLRTEEAMAKVWNLAKKLQGWLGSHRFQGWTDVRLIFFGDGSFTHRCGFEQELSRVHQQMFGGPPTMLGFYPLNGDGEENVWSWLIKISFALAGSTSEARILGKTTKILHEIWLGQSPGPSPSSLHISSPGALLVWATFAGSLRWLLVRTWSELGLGRWREQLQIAMMHRYIDIFHGESNGFKVGYQHINIFIQS